MIYLVKEGKAIDADTVYCTVSGAAKRCKRVYMADGGKAKLLWEKGTRAHPFVLRKFEDLKLITENPSAYFVLGNNITIPNDKTQLNEMFPLLYDKPFTGVLDGQGYGIRSTGGAYDHNCAELECDTKQTVSSDGKKTKAYLFGTNRGIITRLDLRNVSWMFIKLFADHYGTMVGENYGTIDQIKMEIGFHPVRTTGSVNTSAMVCINRGKIQECDIENGRMAGQYTIKTISGCLVGVAYDNYGTIDNVFMGHNVYGQTTGLPSGEAIKAICYENKKGGVIKNSWYDNRRFAPYVKNSGTIGEMGIHGERVKFDKVIY